MDDGWDDSGWGEPVVTSPRNSSVTISSNSSLPDWSSDSTVTKSGHKGHLHNNDHMNGNIGRGRGISPVNRFQENNAVPGIAATSSWAPVDEIDDWTTDFSSQKQSNEPSLNGNTLTIFIPVHETGRIIGRQGSTVKDLQYQSGARINIGRDAINFETKIEITGNEDQRNKALSLIERITGGSYGIGSRDNQSKTEEKKEEVYFDWAEAVKESEEATKAKWAALAPVVKNFYTEDSEVTNMTVDDVSQFRQNNNNVSISHFSEDDERKFPNPCVNFRQAFNKFPDILSEIERNGFSKPSPIQAQSWPVLLQGIDLIGIAQTGTGKTLAYLLPAMIHIEGQTTPRNKRTGPTALILAPTRELAQQIEKEARKYSFRGIKTICIYGGADRRGQSNRAQSGVEIVIATPGRLNDLCSAKIIDLTSVSYLVLDEADRMLDMGFEPQIKKVMIDIRPDRQTVMMSATWPLGVRQLALNYMDKPFQVYVNTLDLAACHSVTQKVIFKSFEEKRPYLEEFIRGMAPDDKVIVFVGKKIICDEISSDMALKGIEVQCIHGDRDQTDREQALEDLKTGQVRVLIATDVASRGLDIDDITHILNLDFPRNIEEYVHRIGRTGRAGKSGTSITIMSREDWKHAKELIDILLEAHQEVPDELREMAQRYKAHQEKKAEEERVYGVRGGGGSGCFKCGQEGHFSRECLSGGEGGSRGIGGFSAGGGGFCGGGGGGFGGGGRRGGGRW